MAQILNTTPHDFPYDILYSTFKLSLFQSVLKEDRNNYVALVLFGASLQESDQHNEAPKAFKKACEVAPDQPLAWQGLVSYYEKHRKNVGSEADTELLKAYAPLISIET